MPPGKVWVLEHVTVPLVIKVRSTLLQGLSTTGKRNLAVLTTLEPTLTALKGLGPLAVGLAGCPVAGVCHLTVRTCGFAVITDPQ